MYLGFTSSSFRPLFQKVIFVRTILLISFGNQKFFLGEGAGEGGRRGRGLGRGEMERGKGVERKGDGVGGRGRGRWCKKERPGEGNGLYKREEESRKEGKVEGEGEGGGGQDANICMISLSPRIPLQNIFILPALVTHILHTLITRREQ